MSNAWCFYHNPNYIWIISSTNSLIMVLVIEVLVCIIHKNHTNTFTNTFTRFTLLGRVKQLTHLWYFIASSPSWQNHLLPRQIDIHWELTQCRVDVDLMMSRLILPSRLALNILQLNCLDPPVTSYMQPDDLWLPHNICNIIEPIIKRWLEVDLTCPGMILSSRGHIRTHN